MHYRARCDQAWPNHIRCVPPLPMCAPAGRVRYHRHGFVAYGLILNILPPWAGAWHGSHANRWRRWGVNMAQPLHIENERLTRSGVVVHADSSAACNIIRTGPTLQYNTQYCSINNGVRAYYWPL
jgi:hypothetical protein